MRRGEQGRLRVGSVIENWIDARRDLALASFEPAVTAADPRQSFAACPSKAGEEGRMVPSIIAI